MHIQNSVALGYLFVMLAVVVAVMNTKSAFNNNIYYGRGRSRQKRYATSSCSMLSTCRPLPNQGVLRVKVIDSLRCGVYWGGRIACRPV